MTAGGALPEESRFSAWCGWVLVGVAGLTPVGAWLGPLVFAPLIGLAGLLTLPSLRVRDEDRPAAIGLLAMGIWAVGSMVWSPYRPDELGEATAVKLVVQAVLYAAFVCAVRRAAADKRALALRLLAWGMAALGAMLTFEAVSAAAAYSAVRDLIGDPIRPDLAIKNVAQAGFVLTLLAPPAVIAAARDRQAWLALPMAAGIVSAAVAFGYDALLIALGASLAAGLAVHFWPKAAPRILAGVAAAFFLGAPFLVWAARANGWYAALEANVPLSWSMRMGYWRHAADWISDHPFRGWGLDASRMFSPGINLHPHDSALQIWLELGLIGATGAAVFYAAMLSGLARPRRDAGVAAAAAAAIAYLTFSAFSFGVWQEWWLGLGALATAVSLAVMRQPAALPGKSRARASARPSTPPVFSE